MKRTMRRDLLILAALAAAGGAGGALMSEPGHNAAPAALVQTAPVVAPAYAHPVLAAARGVLGTAGIESATEQTQVGRALAALAPHVKKQSDPQALKMAVEAYFNYQAAHP